MITIGLRLDIGTYKNFKYDRWDFVNLEYDEDAGNILDGFINKGNVAKLLLTNSMDCDIEITRFKRIKLKNHGYKWIVSGWM
jgi:hypothetical protein